jgi:hypothetical protein
MSKDMHISALQIPLYGLQFAKNIRVPGSVWPELLASLRKDYDEQMRSRIIESLRWAVQNPDYPFSSLLPGLEVHSNEDIHGFLANLLAAIDNAD